MNDAEARPDGPAPLAREPYTGWHRAVERLNIETDELAEMAFARGETAGARQFLWEPLRTFLAAALRAQPERGQPGAVMAGYQQLACAAKLWEGEMIWRERHLETFERGRSFGIVRREWRDTVEQVLGAERAGHALAGGRGGTSRIATEHGDIVLRRARRGGAMRWLGETYFGLRPRPLREFAVLLRARRRGLPVPEPVAALAERRFGIAYRGLLLMRDLGGTPLSALTGAEAPANLVPLLARALRDLHDAGLSHPDLNLGNVLVITRSYEQRIAFVDLDRARLRGRPPGLGARRRSLRRLRRSAHKLDPSGRLLPEAALDRLEEIYWSLGAAPRLSEEAARGPSR
ncbi:MAG: lipopolysaccharide kinase InaA family protein [Candidatus Binatia bacterium]